MALDSNSSLRAAVLAGALACSTAFASVPGVVQDTLRRPTPPPVNTQAPALPAAANAPRTVDPNARTVVIQRFEFVGNSQLDNATLQAVVVGYIGQALTVEQLFDIADAVTATYRAKGFGLATVVVPAQRVDDGSVRFEVIEGFIAAVGFEGNADYSATTLQRFTPEVKAGRVYRTDEVERAVLRLNDLPGVDARVVVQPGRDYGTSDLAFKVVEDPASYTLTADDHGRDAIGRQRLLFDATWNNPTGNGDDLRLGLVHAEANLLNYASLTYGMPVGYAGKRLAFNVNYTDYIVDDPAFLALGVGGDNYNVRMDYTQPLARDRSENLVLLAALAYSGSETEIAAVTAETALSWGEIGLFWNRVYPDNSSLVTTVTLASNFAEQDAALTDPDGIDSEAMLARVAFDLGYAQPLGQSWSWGLRLNGVWSPETLPDLQKYSVGGPYQMRAYDSSEVRGDHGASLAFSLDRRFQAFGAGHSVSLFAESALVTTYDLTIGVIPVGGGSINLADAGIAFNLNPQGRWGATLQYATSFDSYTSPTGDDGHAWLSFAYRF